MDDVGPERREVVEKQDPLGSSAEFTGDLMALGTATEEGNGAAGVVGGPEGTAVVGVGAEAPRSGLDGANLEDLLGASALTKMDHRVPIRMDPGMNSKITRDAAALAARRDGRQRPRLEEARPRC